MAHTACPTLAGFALALVFATAPAACTDKADASAGQPVAGDLDAQIAQRVGVRESPTVFAVFAMLNAAGYDEETRPTMHPVRRSVRGALPRILSDTVFLRVERYYRAHPTSGPAAYAAVTMLTNGPPDFTPASESAAELRTHAEYRALADLPALLRTFARGLPLDSLYRTHQLAFRAVIADYTAEIRREVTAALRYARVRDVGELTGTGEFAHVVVIPSLLVAYDRAFSFVIGDTFYSIQGPQTVPGFNPHEFIHAIVNPVSLDTVHFGAAHKKAMAAYLAVRDTTARKISSLTQYVEESLVRAVVLRYGVANDPARDSASVAAAASDARKGLVLVPYFCEQLKLFEQQADPLRVYYPKLFEQLDAQRELTRWRDSTLQKRPEVR